MTLADDPSWGDTALPTVGYLATLRIGVGLVLVLAVAGVWLLVVLRRGQRQLLAEVAFIRAQLPTLLRNELARTGGVIPGPQTGQGQALTPAPPR